MSVERTADVTWSGDLTSGSGSINEVTSGVIAGLPVTWGSRTDAHEGRTSPEELVAAAHASCFSMAFSGQLGRNGTPPEALDVRAAVSFEKRDAGWRVTRSHLTVRGRVPGIDDAKFHELAESAKDSCPISQALKGNVELSVEATLEA
jgi:lipoyl-dependent peroxiredoxin